MRYFCRSLLIFYIFISDILLSSKNVTFVTKSDICYIWNYVMLSKSKICHILKSDILLCSKNLTFVPYLTFNFKSDILLCSTNLTFVLISEIFYIPISNILLCSKNVTFVTKSVICSLKKTFCYFIQIWHWH